MAIPKVDPRTILLVGKETSIMKEAIAAGTIVPGDLVALDSTGKWKAHDVAGGQAARAFAVEADLIGKGIDDNYVANDWVYTWIVPNGAEVNARVAAAATAIVVGDLLESAGNGTLRKLTPASGLTVGGEGGTVVLPGNAVAIALKAVDNSGGESAVRIPVLVL